MAVYAGHKITSMRAANDISRYFSVRHPEYYARIVNYDSLREFDSVPGNYSMDLYLLELDACDSSDAGYTIAKRLRDDKTNCALTFIAPSETVAVQVTREMLRPSYVFHKEATESEIFKFLDSFLSRFGELAFIEFTYQYRKWLVNTENITYIQTNGDKTLIVCMNTTLETSERLAELERKLPGHFFRVDKGCLININRLSSVDFKEQKTMFPGDDYV